MAEVSFNATPEKASLEVRHYPTLRLLGKLGWSDEFVVDEQAEGHVVIANYGEDEAEALRLAVVARDPRSDFDYQSYGKAMDRLLSYSSDEQVAKLSVIEKGDPFVVDASMKRDMYFRAKPGSNPYVDQLQKPRVRSFANNLKVVADNFACELSRAISSRDSETRESLLRKSVSAIDLEKEVRKTALSGLLAVHGLTVQQLEDRIASSRS